VKDDFEKLKDAWNILIIQIWADKNSFLFLIGLIFSFLAGCAAIHYCPAFEELLFQKDKAWRG